MTIKRRLIVGIEDIKGVCFECLKCSARTTVAPDKIGDIPRACPRCEHIWLTHQPSAYENIRVSPFVGLTSSIERIWALNKEGVNHGFCLSRVHVRPAVTIRDWPELCKGCGV
jgi:hypothetical protein